MGLASCRRNCSPACKDRIDIDFAFTNKTDFAADEAVKLDLFVKNVPHTVGEGVRGQHEERLPHASCGSGHRHQPRWPRGQLASRPHKYDDSPLRRTAASLRVPRTEQARRVRHRLHRRRQEQPGADSQGPLARRSSAPAPRARRFVTVDERANQPVNDATVWLGGREYSPTRTARSRSRSPPIPAAGRSSSAAAISPASIPSTHQPEAYRLDGRHPRRSREPADAAHRAGRSCGRCLFLNDTPVSLKLLEDVRLRITSVDHNDIPSSTEVPDFTLFEDRESVHEIRVPARLWTLTIVLTAKVKSPEHRQAGGTGGVARRFRSTRSSGPTRSRTCIWRSSAATT